MTAPHVFKLDGRTPIPCSMTEFGEMFQNVAGRTVAKTALDGGVEVSTVFLGLDHNFSGTGPPILFETLVFGGALHCEGERYVTWEEAEAGHERWCRRVTGLW